VRWYDLSPYDEKVFWDSCLPQCVNLAVLVIIAKLSDLFGRRFMLILSLITFIVFSAACGASQSLAQL
jgi:MFS family permease